MKYLEVFGVVIIYEVCSVDNICDTGTSAFKIVPDIDIPFYTLKIPIFLTELNLYYSFSLKYSHF